MKSLLLTLLCLTSLWRPAWAAEGAAPVALKQQSTFAMPSERSPFWPIGWKKPDPKKTDSASAGPALTPASFALTSVTTGGGGRFAILNGKIMQEGQKFGLQIDTHVYEVTVQAIQDGQVMLSSEGGEIVVPLRRH